MSEQIKVERIEIKIGKKVLSLTPEEMKELRDVLDQTFPKEKVTYIPGQPIIIDYPRPWKWWEPIWMDRTTNEVKRIGTRQTPEWQASSVLRLECKSAP